MSKESLKDAVQWASAVLDGRHDPGPDEALHRANACAILELYEIIRRVMDVRIDTVLKEGQVRMTSGSRRILNAVRDVPIIDFKS